jgi:hypothetical protein
VLSYFLLYVNGMQHIRGPTDLNSNGCFSDGSWKLLAASLKQAGAIVYLSDIQNI